MASIVNLYARAGEGAVLTLWRTGITNADTVVTLTTTADATAVAYIDASGDDQGRVDIVLGVGDDPGIYAWSAEIDSVEVWTGQIVIGPHGYPTSCLASSQDIRTERVPQWVIPRPADVEGGAIGGGGPATQIDETGGPTTLDIDAIADGEYLQRVGTEIVGATPSGSGDVTAAAAFATDNRVIRSDGTGKGVQASTVSVTDAGAVAGITTLSMTDNLTMATGKTVDGRDVSVDGATLDDHIADTANPHSVTAAQAGAIATSAKGAANGVASLDSSTYLVEAAQVLRATGVSLTIGAVTDGQYLVRSGSTVVGATLDLDTLVPGTAAASQVPRRNAGDTAFEWATLSASDVSAIATSAKGAASGVATLDSSTFLVEAAQVLRATGVSLTLGSVTDGQYLVRSGTTVVGISPDLDTWVPGTATASQVPRRNSGDTAFEWATLTASDVSAIATTAKGAASGVASLNSSTRLVEAAEKLYETGGPTTLTVGSVADGQLLKRSGSSVIGVAAANTAPIVLITTADFTTGSTSLVDIAPASGPSWSGISIVASKTYRFTAHITHQASATTTILRLGVNASNTPSSLIVRATIGAAQNTGSWGDESLYAIATATANSTNVTAGSTSYYALLTGTFVASASGGTFSIQTRTRINSSSETITIKAGSSLVLEQLD